MRGVAPLVAIACLLLAAGTVSAARSTSGVNDLLHENALDLFDAPSLFDLWLLPSGVVDELGLADAELPGPNEQLEPDLTLLMRNVGTLRLPALPTLDPLASLETAPAGSSGTMAAAGATRAATAATDATMTQDEALTAQRGGSASSSAETGPSTASEQGAAAPSLASAAKARWDDLSTPAKVGLGVGLVSLLAGPLAMYSRIHRDDALKNKTRRRIHDIVEANPSLCIKDIAERAEVSYSTASYHLDRLVKNGFLVANEQGNRVCYFKNGGAFSRDERDLVPILQNDECMRVFNHVLEHPWCYRAEVAQALGVSHTTVNWHLRRLIDAQLIEEHREGRNCHLFIDQPALDRILTVLDKMEQTGSFEQVTGAPETPVPA